MAAESRVELTLPRPTKMYEATTLQTQLLRRERMAFSLNLDPVNEEAVAAKRTDPLIPSSSSRWTRRRQNRR